MIETLVYLYLILGCGVGLVVWYASFDRDFDQYVRDFHQEEPPTTREKWVTVIFAPLFWPFYLWKAFK